MTAGVWGGHGYLNIGKLVGGLRFTDDVVYNVVKNSRQRWTQSKRLTFIESFNFNKTACKFIIPSVLTSSYPFNEKEMLYNTLLQTHSTGEFK